MLLCCCLLVSLAAWAQPETESSPYSKAKAFMQQQDYSNAVLVLQGCLQQDPNNLQYGKDLALCYFFQKDIKKAEQTIEPILDRSDADDQCYQIAGFIYKEKESLKDCERMYRKGIKRFPSSGALYNDLGELLWAQLDYSAIKYWLDGMEADPNYSRNYYNACRFYYLSADKIWSLIYGEIFVNMEPMGSNTAEIKGLLLEGYKKFYTAEKSKIKFTSGFAARVNNVLNQQAGFAASGITPESLTIIRTRFILEWMNDGQKTYPHQLFVFQQQLLREGLFSAYNQWLFGPAYNLSAYQHWIENNKAEYEALIRFQKGRVFKMPPSQTYR